MLFIASKDMKIICQYIFLYLFQLIYKPLLLLVMSFKADEIFLKADQLISADDIAGARVMLYGLLQDFPDYGRAHNHLGWINENKLRYFDKAEEHYKAALRFSPEYPAAWINYTYFLNMQERFDELIDHLNKALNVKGVSKSFVYNEFGAVAEMRGEYESAIDYYKKAIRFSQNDENIKRYEQSIERVEKKKEMGV